MIFEALLSVSLVLLVLLPGIGRDVRGITRLGSSEVSNVSLLLVEGQSTRPTDVLFSLRIRMMLLLQFYRNQRLCKCPNLMDPLVGDPLDSHENGAGSVAGSRVSLSVAPEVVPEESVALGEISISGCFSS